MSTLKVTNLRHSSASSDAITLASDGTATIGECTAKITNNLSNKNLIINGAFNVAQRATSGTGSGYKSVDRFYISKSADEDPTQAQHALTSSDTGPWAKGFRNSFHITNGNNSSNTGGNQSIWYEVEAQDIANSGWDYNSASSYITLSFWVKSSVAQTFYAYIVSNDGTAKRHAFSLGSLSANTWTQVTKSFPGHADLQFDNDTGKGLSIGIHMFAPAGQTDSGVSLTEWATHSGSERMPDFATTWWQTNDATFEITGVQLEVGDTATDFEHRSYGDELLRCQRYCWVQGGTDTYTTFANGTIAGSTSFEGRVGLPTTMRAKPSVTFSGNMRVWDAGPSVSTTAVNIDSGAGSPQSIHHTATCSSASFTTGRSAIFGAENDTSAKIIYAAEP